MKGFVECTLGNYTNQERGTGTEYDFSRVLFVMLCDYLQDQSIVKFV